MNDIVLPPFDAAVLAAAVDCCCFGELSCVKTRTRAFCIIAYLLNRKITKDTEIGSWL